MAEHDNIQWFQWFPQIDNNDNNLKKILIHTDAFVHSCSLQVTSKPITAAGRGRQVHSVAYMREFL